MGLLGIVEGRLGLGEAEIGLGRGSAIVLNRRRRRPLHDQVNP